MVELCIGIVMMQFFVVGTHVQLSFVLRVMRNAAKQYTTLKNIKQKQRFQLEKLVQLLQFVCHLFGQMLVVV